MEIKRAILRVQCRNGDCHWLIGSSVRTRVVSVWLRHVPQLQRRLEHSTVASGPTTSDSQPLLIDGEWQTRPHTHTHTHTHTSQTACHHHATSSNLLLVYFTTSNQSNTEVLRRTQLSTVLCDNRLRLLGHVARSDARMDHSRALRAVISRLPSHWRRPPGRPRQSWTRTIKTDLNALSIGLNTAWRWAQDHEQWQRTMKVATLQHGAWPRWWWW